MNLSIYGIEPKINLDENITVLEIEDKKFFVKTIEKFYNKINSLDYEENEFVIMDEDEIIDFSKKVMLVTDVFNIDFNSKKILKKLYEKISFNIKISDENKLEELSLELRNYLISEINEIPIEFIMNSDINTEDLLKAFNLKVDSSLYNNSVLERIEFLIDIVKTLELANIIVIPNLKIFLNEEELLDLYKYSVYNNIKLLIIENSAKEKVLKFENKYYIDREFDII